jgi:hypothetical protein
MVAGHTHIPSDGGFAKIEKFSKNRTQAVYDPDGWRQIVLQCNRRKTFHVTVLKSEDFVTAQIDRYDNKKEKVMMGIIFTFQVFVPSDLPGKEKTQCYSNTSLVTNLWKLM